eukprot:1933412-Lingulodinium_polyedra.AAC.1
MLHAETRHIGHLELAMVRGGTPSAAYLHGVVRVADSPQRAPDRLTVRRKGGQSELHWTFRLAE